jgi:hypothetical protein
MYSFIHPKIHTRKALFFKNRDVCQTQKNEDKSVEIILLINKFILHYCNDIKKEKECCCATINLYTSLSMIYITSFLMHFHVKLRMQKVTFQSIQQALKLNFHISILQILIDYIPLFILFNYFKMTDKTFLGNPKMILK